MINRKQQHFLLMIPAILLLYLAAISLIANEAEIKISNAWVRAIPPGVGTTAAYMQMTNYSNTDLELSHFESPQFTAVVAHETIFKDGLAHMIDAEKLIIPAKGKLDFAPEGLHLMLITSKVKLIPGKEITITLFFSDNSQYTIHTKVALAPPLNLNNKDS